MLSILTDFAAANYRRLIRTLILVVVLGIGVYLLLPQITTLEDAGPIIRRLSAFWLGMAALAEMASYLGLGDMLRAIVQRSGRPYSIWRGAIIILAATSLGLVAGGIFGIAAATYRWMDHEDVPAEAAALSGTMPTVLITIVLVLVSLVGLVHLVVIHELTRCEANAFLFILLFLLGLVGFTAWGLNHRARVDRMVERFDHWWVRVTRRPLDAELVEESVDNLFKARDLLRGRGWVPPFLGAVLYTGLDMLALFFVFTASGHTISPGILLAGYGLPLLLSKAVFMVPGGIGIIEGTMAAIYSSLAVPESVIVVVVFTYRLISFWLPLASGFILIGYLQRRSRRTAREDRRER